MHHAGDLDRRRIAPGRLRGRAGGAGRVAGLGRRHQVEYHAVGDPAGQLKHPRPERGQVDRQVRTHRRAVERHHAGAEHPAVIPGGLAAQDRPDDAHVLFDHRQRGKRRYPEPGVHHRVRHPQAEDEPAACRLVQLRRGLGGQHRRPQGRVRDRGPHPHCLSGGGHRMAQRQRVAVPFGHEHRAEARQLGGMGQGADAGRPEPAVRSDGQGGIFPLASGPLLRRAFPRRSFARSSLLAPQSRRAAALWLAEVSCARSSRLSTLPVVVRGNAVANSTLFGHL